MQDHHKKARQKEAKRNKLKRDKERDAIALQTKTSKQVKEEIQKLERDMKRHHHNQQQRDGAEKKLLRLQRELTLLQDAEKTAREKADADAEAYRIANKYRQPQRPLTELDDPRKSVYYDPVMNPFGAPPPGKPRLYHRRFGGVTPNPNEAVVPGEEALPPPPPPPPPRDTRPHHHHRDPNSRNNNSHQRQNLQRPPQIRQSKEQQRGEPSSQSDQNPPKRQPLHMPPPRKSDSINEEAKNKNGTWKNDIGESSKPHMPKEEEKPTTDNHNKPSNDTTTQESLEAEAKPSSPPAIPSLPAPSAAVQRTMRVAQNKSKTKRGKALADIWASNEEVEYERLTNLVDLEADDVGTAAAKTKKKKKKKKKKPPLEFYYRDNSGTVQGPYSKAQMRSWIDAGYFPLTTKARTNRMDPDGWVPMGDLPALKEEPVSSKSDANNVQDRIAALKSGENNDDENDMDAAMQARIAAMRADLMASSGPSENPIDEDSVQGRIAALKGNANNDGDEEGMDASMQARIAAMRADLMPSSAPNNPDEGDDSVQARIAALKGNATSSLPSDDDGIDSSMQARIAAMRADMAGSSADAGEETYEVEASVGRANEEMSIQDRIAALRKNAPPPPVAPSQQNTEEGTSNLSLQDRIAALRQNAPPPPPPPPPAYPVDSENQYSIGAGVSAYPVQDADDAGASAYPIDNEDPYGVAAYPTGDEDGVAAYPVDEPHEEDEAYAPYPTGEAYPGAEDLAYPVVDSYPVEDDNDDLPPYAVSDVKPASEGNVGPSVPASKTKVVKVDKALVSFVPSNLQKKRKAEAPGSNEDLKKKKKSTKQDDNYDKFLKEIDDL